MLPCGYRDVTPPAHKTDVLGRRELTVSLAPENVAPASPVSAPVPTSASPCLSPASKLSPSRLRVSPLPEASKKSASPPFVEQPSTFPPKQSIDRQTIPEQSLCRDISPLYPPSSTCNSPEPDIRRRCGDWLEVWDRRQNRTYYFNDLTEVSKWSPRGTPFAAMAHTASKGHPVSPTCAPQPLRQLSASGLPPPERTVFAGTSSPVSSRGQSQGGPPDLTPAMLAEFRNLVSTSRQLEQAIAVTQRRLDDECARREALERRLDDTLSQLHEAKKEAEISRRASIDNDMRRAAAEQKLEEMREQMHRLRSARIEMPSAAPDLVPTPALPPSYPPCAAPVPKEVPLGRHPSGKESRAEKMRELTAVRNSNQRKREDRCEEPYLYVNVMIGSKSHGRIPLYRSSDLRKAAEDFVLCHNLSRGVVDKLISHMLEAIAAHEGNLKAAAVHQARADHSPRVGVTVCRGHPWK